MILIRKIFRCLIIFFFVTSSINVYADKASTLENLRARIKDVGMKIKGAKNEVEKLQMELHENEIITTDMLARLHDIEQNISTKKAEIAELEIERNEYQKILNYEKEKLAQQIRATYQTGRNDYIKLILNQDDLILMGRAMAYYNYHNHVRSKRIDSVKKTLSSLTTIQSSIQSETKKLQELKVEHEKKLLDFHQYRTSRHEIMVRLQQYIDEQGIELQTLQANERELEKLLQDLKEEETVTVEILEDIRPFNTLKGQLAWPVKGKLLKKFGRPKKGGNLKWQGVLIGARVGTSVKAISTGKVIFADWFRNLGLLIIIDHGDGYMSLYGHNQNLLKNTGDWVSAEEQIATVGDSGGQQDMALYFEIRRDTKPLNPTLWCKK